jgi:uncharacterized membrane protein
MEYQELINIWSSSNDELKTNVQINRKLIKEVAFKKIKAQLAEIRWTSVFGLAVAFFWIPFLIRFVVANFGDLKFCLQGLLLLGISLFSMILNVYKLQLYYSINSRFSVLKTQHKIERLKYLELLDVKSLYIIIPLFSAPFFIVIAKAFLHIDLFSFGIFGKALLYYTLGAIVVAIILVFILSKSTDKKLKESIAFLNELKETESPD